jgi:hypothetical protein
VLTINGGTISTITNAIVDTIDIGTMKVAVTITNTTVQFFGVNTYTGPTLVKNGGTLGGTGSFLSPITVENGGKLSPGASTGTLNAANLTLNAGSTSYFEVTHTPGDYDKVAGLTNVTLGGTLVITNTGVAPLAAGDSFQLFAATTFQGNFSSIQLPSLGAGLAWNTNALAGSGLLSVVSTTPHADGISRRTDGNMQLTISGPVGSGYSVHASTNVALPLGSWSLLSSGTITVSPFNYEDLNATNFPQRFYRISIP